MPVQIRIMHFGYFADCSRKYREDGALLRPPCIFLYSNARFGGCTLVIHGTIVKEPGAHFCHLIDDTLQPLLLSTVRKLWHTHGLGIGGQFLNGCVSPATFLPMPL